MPEILRLAENWQRGDFRHFKERFGNRVVFCVIHIDLVIGDKGERVFQLSDPTGGMNTVSEIFSG